MPRFRGAEGVRPGAADKPALQHCLLRCAGANRDRFLRGKSGELRPSREAQNMASRAIRKPCPCAGPEPRRRLGAAIAPSTPPAISGRPPGGLSSAGSGESAARRAAPAGTRRRGSADGAGGNLPPHIAAAAQGALQVLVRVAHAAELLVLGAALLAAVLVHRHRLTTYHYDARPAVPVTGCPPRLRRRPRPACAYRRGRRARRSSRSGGTLPS